MMNIMTNDDISPRSLKDLDFMCSQLYLRALKCLCDAGQATPSDLAIGRDLEEGRLRKHIHLEYDRGCYPWQRPLTPEAAELMDRLSQLEIRIERDYKED